MKPAYKKQLLNLIAGMDSAREIDALLQALLTPSEYEDIIMRLQIVKELQKGTAQRDIAKKLGVSIAKVTRGSHLIQEKSTLVRKVFDS